MKKTYYEWEALRQAGGQGLSHISGQVIAHGVKEARLHIDADIAGYAQQGLVRGDYVLRLTSFLPARRFADRTIFIHSIHSSPIPNTEVDQSRPLVNLAAEQLAAGRPLPPPPPPPPPPPKQIPPCPDCRRRGEVSLYEVPGTYHRWQGPANPSADCESCPWCGVTDQLLVISTGDDRRPRRHVWCPMCHVIGPEGLDDRGAVVQWNNRQRRPVGPKV